MSQIEREKAAATVDLLDRLAEVLDVELVEFFKKPEAGTKRPKVLKSGRKSLLVRK